MTVLRSFGCTLLLLSSALGLRAEQVVLSEIMYHPPAGKPEFIEVQNVTSTVFDIAGWRLTDAVKFEFPEFSPEAPGAAFLRPFERVVLSSDGPEATRLAYGIPNSVRVFGPWAGQLADGQDRVTLQSKDGVVICTVQYSDRGRWSPAADGAGHSLVLKDANRAVDDWRNWTVSARPGGTPGTAGRALGTTVAPSPEIELPSGRVLLGYDAEWRYDDSGQDLGAAWREPNFDDSQWRSGPGLLGFESGVLREPGLKTPLRRAQQPAYYFRTRFVFDPSQLTPGAKPALVLDQFVDDGAVYYLNGKEIGRSRMPEGPVRFGTLAVANVADAVEEMGALRAGPDALRPGTNVLAVELHQGRARSSDAVLGVRLRLAATPAPGVVLNELFAAAKGGFVEFFNAGTNVVNLKGHFLSDDPRQLRKHAVSRDLVLAPRGLASLALAECGLTPTNGALAVFLTAPDGANLLSAASADFSMDARALGRMPAGSGAWFRFAEASPGAANFREGGAEALRLNEAHFRGGSVDWVEVFNTGEAPLLLQGVFIASRRDFSDKVALSGRLGGGGWASWDAGFPVVNGEVTLYLVDTAGTVLDCQVLAAPRASDTAQAFPDGGKEWFTAAGHTRNAANNPSRQTNVVINEIMFDPPVTVERVEYVELFNRGERAVDLSGWRFTEGVAFDFPPGTRLAAGGFLVVASSAARFSAVYGGAPALGNFRGKLRNRGELIRLLDERGNLADEVDFHSGGDWPALVKGGGSSLELAHPALDNSLASAWRDSDESQKGPWRTYARTNTYLELSRLGAPSDYQELHFHLVGEGHVALRNIGLWKDGVNCLRNPTRLSTDGSGGSGWLAQGTHWASFMTNGELHIVSDGRGDNRPNHVEIDCAGLKRGERYVLRFEGRWISGNPRLIAQSWDHSLGGSFLLEVPPPLGTPGKVNSVLAAAGVRPSSGAETLEKGVPQDGPNASKRGAVAAAEDARTPPQVDHLSHSPPVPRSTNTVRVTAEVFSLAPLASVRLFHRADSSSGNALWASKPMFDDGAHGDAAAGDGEYTAELTEHKANGRVVQFFVEARTQNGLACVLPRGGQARPALYVVDDRFIPRDLRTDRFVVSAYDLGSIADGQSARYGFRHPRHSNHYYNMTFISNEEQIFYGGEIRTSGSPWTRDGDLGKGKWKLPDDRPFRGRTKFFYDNDSHYHNRVTRYLLHLLGHPTSEAEWVRVVVNHSGPELREDTEPVGNEFLDRNFEGGSQGELYRIDDEWWFADDGNRNSRDADWSYKRTDDPLRYRTEWMKRSREAEDDFRALIGFFKTVSANDYTQDEIERLLDRDAVLKIAAVRGFISDWDSFTLSRGKNGYFYRRPGDGRFQFFHWDSDLAFGHPDGPFYGDRIRPWIELPYNRRLFFYWLNELGQWATSPRLEAWFQAEEAASRAYSPNAGFYREFFRRRYESALRAMGKNHQRPLEIRTNAGAPLTTTNATLALAGTAPYAVYAVVAEQAPHTKPTWSNSVNWLIAGIPLKPGENVLTVRGLHHSGRIVAEAKLTVTRTNGIAPAR